MQPPLLLEIRSKVTVHSGRRHRGMLAMPGDIVANANSDRVRTIKTGRAGRSCRSNPFERNFVLANDISFDCARTGIHKQSVCGIDSRIHPNRLSPDASSGAESRGKRFAHMSLVHGGRTGRTNAWAPAIVF
jgi:hypothetical protein